MFLTYLVQLAQDMPPVPPGFYDENPLDRFALSLFRRLVQREIGFASDKPGYDGLLEEARYYMLEPGVTTQDQQAMVRRVLAVIAGPVAPIVYRAFMAPWPWAPLLTALFTPPFFKFLVRYGGGRIIETASKPSDAVVEVGEWVINDTHLCPALPLLRVCLSAVRQAAASEVMVPCASWQVGPNRMDLRDDGLPGGVYAERCRFLEETKCKGLCLNMCKLPTEQFFKETMGMDMTMAPNFETGECRLSFGLAPKPVEEDETIPAGCLQGCGAARIMLEKEMDRRPVCSRN
jgi:hypothetical protein